ncbi:MAG: hypothetical protein ACYS26_07005 [Planctomycetota bacterium]
MRKRFERDGVDLNGPYRSYKYEHDSWEDEELLFEDPPPVDRELDRRSRGRRRWSGSRGDNRRELFLEDDDFGPRRRRRRRSA